MNLLFWKQLVSAAQLVSAERTGSFHLFFDQML